MPFTQDFWTSRNNNNESANYVGQQDRLWYDPDTNTIRVSDGTTPGGVVVGGGGGNGSPGGTNSTVQFNQSGTFGGQANFTFNRVSGLLSAPFFSGDGSNLTNIAAANIVGIIANSEYANSANTANFATNSTNANFAANATNANFATNSTNANFAANATNANFATNSTNANFAANATNANFATNSTNANFAANSNYAAYAGNVVIAAQSNITSLGTLTGLTSNGVVNFANASNVSLGAVANVHITGGSNGQVLSTDGSGNLSWTTSSSGNGVPGGSNTQVQFNSNGVFGASANFTFVDNANGGTLTVDTVQSLSNQALNILGSDDTGSGAQGIVIEAGGTSNASLGGSIEIKAGAGGTGSGAINLGTENTAQVNIGGLNVAVGIGGNVSFSNGYANLGSVANVRITGGSSGQILTTYGNGSLTWGNTTPTETNIIGVTSEPTGFPDPTLIQSNIAFYNANRTFTIQANTTTGNTYSVWVKGTQYTKNSLESVTVNNTTQLYYISYDSNGALQANTETFDLANVAPVAMIYWNSTTGSQEYFGDERHGVVMDWQTHEYLHRTRGAVYATGFVINATTTGTGSANVDAQIGISNGTFYDEDIQIDIVATTTPVANTWQQDLALPGKIPVFYRSGTAWVLDNPTDFPLKFGSARCTYNLNTGGTWSTPDITNNSYGVMFILATNNLNYPVISLMGQQEFSNQSTADATLFSDLDLVGLPLAELRPLYKLVFQVSNGYANDVKARIRATYDLRTDVSVIAASSSAIDVVFREQPQGVFDTDATANTNWYIWASNVGLMSTGTSNVQVLGNSVAGGNVTVGVGGVANVVVISDTGLTTGIVTSNISNTRSLSANVSVDFSLTNSVSLGSVANLDIAGGSNGQVLSTDGSGNLSWISAAGVPSGSNTQIQFNNANAFGASANLTFDRTTNTLTTTNVAATLANITTANVGDLIVTGNVRSNLLPNANVTYDLGSNTQRWRDIWLANSTIYLGEQTITSNATTVSFSGNVVANVVVSTNATFSGSNVTLGNVANIRIVGGSANQFLRTDGNANLTWADIPVATTLANGNSNIAILSNGNITVSSAGNSNIVTVTGTGANITGTLNVTSNVIVGGNLTVTGNVSYVQANNLYVTDPLIEAGGGPNGDPLTNNDGHDRGLLLNYYTSAPVVAYIGWKNANSEFQIGSNVSVVNNVVTINTLGNLLAQTFKGNVVGNITATTITTDTITANKLVNGNSNITVTANGNILFSAIGNANILTITDTGAVISGTANISGNTSVANISASGTANISGNTSLSNLAVSGAANVTGNLSVEANSSLKIGGNTGSATYWASIKMPTANISANYTLTLPIGTGTANQALITDGSGILSWGSPPSPSRTTANISTGNLANGSTFTGNLTGFKSYALLSVNTSVGAWVRVYSNIASSNNDSARAISTNPTPGTGVLAEVATGGSTASNVQFTPATIGFNNEATANTNIPIRITNLSGNTANITVTLHLVRLES